MTQRPLSILHVLTTRAPRYGGPPRMAELCTALGRRGHHVELISTTVDGPYDLDVPTGVPIEEDGFVSTAFPVRCPREYTFSPELLGWLWRNVARFDVVHTHSIYRFTTLAAARVCRLQSVPYVFHPHGALTAHHRAGHRPRKWLYETLIEKPTARHAGTAIWESAQEREEAVAARWPSGRTIWSGVRVPELDETDGRRPGEVVFLGRLAEKKGVDVLIDSFARVVERFPDAYLRLIGPDDEGREPALRARVAALGLDDKVRFEGVLLGEAKDDALRRASLHVLPSADESFGASAVEAMAYATPVVVTRAFPFALDAEAGRAAVVVDRTPESVADGVSALLADDARAREVGCNGRDYVASRFAWEIIATELETVYRELVVAGSKRGATRIGAVAPDGSERA